MGFNTYGSKNKEYGGGKTVWRKVNAKYQSGATIDISELAVGDIVEAGTPVSLKPASHVATVLKNAGEVTAANEAKLVIGYIENDVVKEDGDTYGTCAVVVDGELYADRCAYDGAVVAAAAYCPKVTLIREVDPE